MDAVYTSYYNNQSGSNVQNIGEIYHTPRNVQYGRGIGSFFSALYSHLKPLFKTGLNILKNKSIDIGKEMLEEIGTKPIKEILLNQGKKVVNNFKEATIDKIKTMQEGKGKRIKLKRLKQRPQIKSKRCRRKTFKDIFGNLKCLDL